MLQSLYFKMLSQFTFPHNNFTGFRTVQTLGLIHKSAREHFKRFVQKSQIHPYFFSLKAGLQQLQTIMRAFLSHTFLPKA